jgi:hypothetical protein
MPHQNSLPAPVKLRLNNVRDTVALEELFAVHDREAQRQKQTQYAKQRSTTKQGAWERVGERRARAPPGPVEGGGVRGNDGRMYYPELGENREEESGGCCSVM